MNDSRHDGLQPPKRSVQRNSNEHSLQDAATFEEQSSVLSRVKELMFEEKKLKNEFQDLIHYCCRALQADFCALLLLTPDRRELQFEGISGKGVAALRGLSVKLGQEVAGRVALDGKARLVSDIDLLSEWSPAIDKLTGKKTTSLVAAPIMVDGEVLGLLEAVLCDRSGHFDDSSLRLLQHFADQVGHEVSRLDLRDTLDLTHSFLPPWLRKTLATEREKIGDTFRKYSMVTCLHADIVRSSLLYEDLPTHLAHQIVKEYSDLMIESVLLADGEVQSHVGDGIHALFFTQTTPQAAATRALLAAKDIQQERAALGRKWKKELGSYGFEIPEIRMGIESGSLTRLSLGNREQSFAILVGSTVNFTEELQRACPPSQILLGPCTAQLLDLQSPKRYLFSRKHGKMAEGYLYRE